MSTSFLAWNFTGFSVIAILFQFALAAGMPWGSASMGGKFPGKYPPKMRFAALLNALFLTLLILVVLTRAQLILPFLFSVSRFAIWFVVGFSALGTLLNTITPSKIERIWAPVAAIQLLSSWLIAISN
jgi:hypothetical protein